MNRQPSRTIANVATWLLVVRCVDLSTDAVASSLVEIDAALSASSEKMQAVVSRWKSVRTFMPGVIDRADLPTEMRGPSFTMPRETELWFDHGRFRVRQKCYVDVYTPDGKQVKGTAFDDSDQAFDGGVAETGARVLAPELALMRRFPSEFMRDNPDALLLGSDFWQAIAWKAPNSHRDTLAGSTLRSLSPLIIFKKEGSGVVRTLADTLPVVDGHECVQVEIREQMMRTEFSLDPHLHYAAREWKRFSAQGNLIEVAHSTDFKKYDAEGALWLPASCLHEFYQYDGWPTKPSGVLFNERTTLEELRLVDGLDDSQISLLRGDYDRPGTLVSDSTHPKAKDLPGGVLSYVIPADPEDLDKAIEGAISGKPFVSSSSPGRHYVWLGINGVVIVLILVLVWRRRHHA